MKKMCLNLGTEPVIRVTTLLLILSGFSEPRQGLCPASILSKRQERPAQSVACASLVFPLLQGLGVAPR